MAQKYTLLYIPHSGLYHSSRGFIDGAGRELKWEGKLTVYESHADAIAARDRILNKEAEKYKHGQIFVIGVDIVEKYGTRAIRATT